MALDLSKIPAQAKERFIAIGKRYGSEDTLAQAQQTLSALSTHGKLLVEYGLPLADGTRLKDAHDLLIAAGVGRLEARSERKQTQLAALQAKDRAKRARKRAHAILKGLLDQAEELGLADHEATIRSVLSQTAFSGDEEEPLARQLDVLSGCLAEKAIEKASRDRGGPTTQSELSDAAKALRTRSAEYRPLRGTPTETQTLDLLDGIIVSICRAARRAARVAAADLGQPALRAVFDLVHLDRRSKPENPEEPSGPTPTPTPTPTP